MKLRIFFVLIIFSFIKTNFAQDISKQLDELVKSNPNKLCLDQIFKTAGIKFEFGTFGTIATANIFSTLCFINPTTETIKNGIIISGKTTYQDSNGKLKIIKKADTPISFEVGIEKTGEFKLSDLYGGLQPIDGLVSFSNVTVTVANGETEYPLYGKQPTINGLNVAGKAITKGFIKSVTDSLGLTDIDGALVQMTM